MELLAQATWPGAADNLDTTPWVRAWI